MVIITLYLRKIMFGFKSPSEDGNLMKLRQTADDLHGTADELEESNKKLKIAADKLEESVNKLMSKKNGKNRKKT